MASLKHIRFPTELTDYIIDEAWDLRPGSDDSMRLISSLALVSHAFRRRVNTHRFATVSLGKISTDAGTGVFLDILKADIWTPDTAIVRHIRRVEIELAVRLGWDKNVHPSVASGAFIEVLDLVFRGPYSISRPKKAFTLSICGEPSLEPDSHYSGIHWDQLTPEFKSSLQTLINSYIGNLEMKLLTDVPAAFFQELSPAKIKLDAVPFKFETYKHTDKSAFLRHQNQPETLDVQHCDFFHHLPPGSLPQTLASVRTLSVEYHCVAYAELIWPHLGSLETLIIYISNDYQFETFEIPYKSLPRIKKLVHNLVFEKFNSKRHGFAQQVHDFISENTPVIPELDLVFQSAFPILERFPNSGRVDDIVQQVDCAEIDSFLNHYCTITAPNSILTIRFHIKVSQVARTEFDIHKFRKEGSAILRDAFPLLNSSSRRGVFDIDFRMQRKARKHKGAILREGIFSVVYRPASDGMML